MLQFSETMCDRTFISVSFFFFLFFCRHPVGFHEGKTHAFTTSKCESLLSEATSVLCWARKRTRHETHGYSLGSVTNAVRAAPHYNTPRGVSWHEIRLRKTRRS